jgi:alpha-L-rhamnosidase
MLDSYWGGMLDLGATSIWEEFDPRQSGIEHYSMYGDKYGKSLCHAWGASPIYLLGKYALGVRPTSAGYETFDVIPSLMAYNSIEGTVPVTNGYVSVRMDKSSLTVLTDKDGGTLKINGKEYKLERNKELTVNLK